MHTGRHVPNSVGAPTKNIVFHKASSNSNSIHETRRVRAMRGKASGGGVRGNISYSNSLRSSETAGYISWSNSSSANSMRLNLVPYLQLPSCQLDGPLRFQDLLAYLGWQHGPKPNKSNNPPPDLIGTSKGTLVPITV